jgi:hypothetical protein
MDNVAHFYVRLTNLNKSRLTRGMVVENNSQQPNNETNDSRSLTYKGFILKMMQSTVCSIDEVQTGLLNRRRFYLHFYKYNIRSVCSLFTDT